MPPNARWQNRRNVYVHSPQLPGEKTRSITNTPAARSPLVELPFLGSGDNFIPLAWADGSLPNVWGFRNVT